MISNRASLAALLLLGAAVSARRISDVSFEPLVKSQDGVFHVAGDSIIEETDKTVIANAAKLFLQDQSDAFTPEEWQVSSMYQSRQSGLWHVYMSQFLNGFRVSNGEASVHMKNLEVVTFHLAGFAHQSEINMDDELLHQEIIHPAEALSAFASSVGLAYDAAPFDRRDAAHQSRFVLPPQELALEPIVAEFNWVQVDGGDHAVLCWHMHVELSDNAFEVEVNAHNGEVVSVSDWVHEFRVVSDDELDGKVAPPTMLMGSHRLRQVQASARRLSVSKLQKQQSAEVPHHNYLAYGMPALDPTLGERFEDKDPWHKEPSPLGWHNQGSGQSDTTIGNNVYAQENLAGRTEWRNNYRPGPSHPEQGQVYNYPIDFDTQPREYQDASISNLFYWNNVVHDLCYVYGFDEVSGNFQETNFGRGGREVDAVQANALDGAGRNNANFRTPADGQRPRMRMYEWTHSPVNRDGDLDSGIIVHEYAHGLSNRLVGGPMNVGCLGSGQSGGMGEGWGDALAIFFYATEETDRTAPVPMGIYAAGRGIRKYPYTTDMEINLHTYKDLNQIGQVHAMGTIWATMLYEVFWNLVDQSGFDADWYYGSGGNNVMLSVLHEGMKLSPCRPNFLQMRDSILLADEQLFAGKHACAIWKGFAKRGLGKDAVDRSRFGNDVTEDFAVPDQCN